MKRLAPEELNLFPVQKTKHHIFPKALGGTNRKENIVLLDESVHKNLCYICTRKKGKRIPIKERMWGKHQLNKNYHLKVRNIRNVVR